MPDKKDLTILLVEDDEGHSDLIKTNLRRAGIINSIVNFRNGKEVVDFIFSGEECKNDNYLMMLDLNMPVMDGYQVLKRVKSDEKIKIMPIIVLTTTSERREVEKCYELGCNVYITKPVEYEKFSKAISDLGLLLSIVKVPEGNYN